MACAIMCFQVFVFDVGGSAWKSYNWSLVTTVATFGKYDPELMCYAHKQRARVVLKGTNRLKYERLDINLSSLD